MTRPNARVDDLANRFGPILFSAPMVRAILAGQKTQTRRAVKAREWAAHGKPLLEQAFVDTASDGPRFAGPKEDYLHVPYENGTVQRVFSPYGSTGDLLWVRETWRMTGACDDTYGGGTKRWAEIEYAADNSTRRVQRVPAEIPLVVSMKWRPSIFMRPVFSRVSLRITGVRVERAHSISRADVLAEGVPEPEIEKWRQWLHPDDCAGHAFGQLWESINGKGSWAANPWVWVISFERAEGASRAA